MKLHRWRNVACLMSLVLAVSITPASAADPQRIERAGRDINIIESSTGPAIIQTDKGTIVINNWPTGKRQHITGKQWSYYLTTSLLPWRDI